MQEDLRGSIPLHIKLGQSKSSDVAPVKNYRWVILSLVFFATTINYLDRQVISLLKDDYLEPLFGWSETDYANIVIAFQVSYALGMVGAGFIIDRIGTKLGYALSLAIWSLAAISHAFASANIFTTVSDMFPKKAVASVVGIGGMIGAIGGILIARTAGLLLDHYKEMGIIETGYYIMFIICATGYIIAWSLFSLIVPQMEKAMI